MSTLDVAVEAARAAGLILQEHADGPKRVSHKGRIDLVTEIDLACETAIRAILQHHTPDIPVLGEEGGGATEATTRWVVDPLDGTTNFVHGFPYYCVSVALEIDGTGEIGVVYDPIRDRMYQARRGQGASANGRPMRVSACADLGSALIGTGFAYDRRERAAYYLRRFEAVIEVARGIRRAGAAALDLALLADGHLDAFWEFGLKRWDVAAGAVLIREAGGQFTDHAGNPVTGHVVSPLASNGALHEPLRQLLAKVDPLSP